MNRRTIGFNPRLSSPGRSRLNTDDWYNKLYQSSIEQYQQQIDNSQNKRSVDYNNSNFANFMDYANADREEFADKFMSVKQPEYVENIDDVVVTPEDRIKQNNNKRKLLKEKKWLSGISGEYFTKEDEKDLKELDSWHKLIYDDGYTVNSIPTGVNKPMSPQEMAIEQARQRLESLGGAPKGYWGRTANKILSIGASSAIGANIGSTAGPIGAVLGGIAGAIFGPDFNANETDKTNLIDDITTSFQKKANQVQVDTSKGKIQRSQELILLAQTGIEEYESLIKQHDDLNKELQHLQQKRQQHGLTQDEINRFNFIEDQLKYQSLKEASALNKLDTLGSYDPYEGLSLGPLTVAWQKLNRALDIDYAPESLDFLNRVDFAYDLGIRDDLSGLKNQLRKMRWARQQNNRVDFNEALYQVKNTLNSFVDNTQARFDGWTKDIEHDQEDIKRIDDNYKVSEYYEIQDQLAQDLGLFSPKKILFSSAGLLGSSMSSTPKSLLRIGSWFLGAGATSIPRVIGAMSLNLASGGAQATDENNAEVGGTFQVSDFIDRLSRHRMLDQVLKDGREQLGDNKAAIEDIITAFTEGRIMFSNNAVRNEMLNIIAGANTQWAYDMNATAPAVWTEAMTTIVPDSWYINTVKYAKSTLPRGVRNVAKNIKGFPEFQRMSRIGEGFIPEEELIRIEQVAQQKGIQNPIISSTIPAFHEANPSATSQFLKAATNKASQFLSNKLATAVEFGKRIPTKFLKGPTSKPFKRSAVSLMARSITQMSSEFWEEDVQSIRQHQRTKGQLGSEFHSGIYNPELLFDNFVDGVRSSWDFIFKDPALATQEEREIWREAKLGALGWLLQGGVPAFVRSTNGTWRQYNMTDVIMQQLLADKAQNDAQLKKGIVFSQRAKDFRNYDEAMQAFDDIERYNEKKNKAAEQSNDEDQVGFTPESLEQNRDFYKNIFVLRHLDFITNILKSAGIEENSQDFHIAISLLARQKDLLSESQSKLDNVSQTIENLKTLLKSDYHFQTYLDKNGIHYTAGPTRPSLRQMPEGKIGGQKRKNIEQKNEKARQDAALQDEKQKSEWTAQQKKQYDEYIDNLFYLASVGSLIEQINSYQQLEQASGRQSNFLKHLRDELDKVNKERKDNGYAKFETIDDVLQFVNDRDLYKLLSDLYRQYDGFSQDVYYATGIYDRMLQKERDTSSKEKRYIYPILNYIKQYKDNIASDNDLYNEIEKDFQNHIKRQQEMDDYFHENEINDTNNIYTGFDGKTYIIIPKVSKDGKMYYTKYRYDEENAHIFGKELPFDREEYYLSKMADEREAEREQSADISDEERIDLGNKRIRRENIQREYANAQYLTGQMYSEGESSDQQSAQDYANQILREQQARSAQREADRQKLAEEVGWNYSEGENTEWLEQEELRENEERRKTEEEQRRQYEENVSARQEPADRPYRLYKDGYEFIETRSKRGKLIYYAKKGHSKIRITQEEYERGFRLQIEETRKNNLRSKSFYEYNPSLSVHKIGLIGKDNAFAQVEAIILNSIYSGNEDVFNNLLEYFRLVLTDDQIYDFRTVWMGINNTINEERESMRNLQDTREAVAQVEELVQERLAKKYPLFSQIANAVSDIIKQYQFVLFKLREFIESVDPEFANDLINKFVQQEYPKTKPIVRKQLSDSNVGVSKGRWVIAIAKAKYHVYTKQGKHIAQSPTGEEYVLTEPQYKFYEFIKKELQPKQLELDFTQPIPTFDPFIEFLQTLKQAADNTPAGVTPERMLPSKPEPIILNGVYFDRMSIQLFLNQPRREVGHFGARSTNVQDETIKKIKQWDIVDNPNILHHLTTPYHYFIKDPNTGEIMLVDRVHYYMNYSNDINFDEIPMIDPRFQKYQEIKNHLTTNITPENRDTNEPTLVKTITSIQNEYNVALAEHFGIDSDTYKNNALNLQGYVDAFISAPQQKKDLIFQELLYILPLVGAYDKNFTHIKAWYESGTILDNLARLIFKGERPVYDQKKFKMSEDIFKKCCDIIYEKKYALDRLRIKVVADEIMVTGDVRGYRVAGVMDMVAVDQQGNIYIVDFKTTGGLRRYMKNSDSTSPVDNRKYNPEEAKQIRKEGSFDIGFDRQFLQGYRQQIALYKYLFEQQFQIPVKNTYIGPIYIERKYGKVNGVTSYGVLDEITNAVPFRHFEITPDNSILKDNEEDVEEIDWTRVNRELDDINNQFNKSLNAIKRRGGIVHGSLLSVWNDLVGHVKDINDSVKDKKSGNIVPEQALYDQLASVRKEIDDFNDAARKVYSSEQQPPKPPQPPVQNPPQQNPQQPQPRGRIFNWEQREATGELEHYNNIAVKELPKTWDKSKKEAFRRVTSLPDFIMNSVWELNTPRYLRMMGTLRHGTMAENTPFISIVVRYTEHTTDGKIINHIFADLALQPSMYLADGTQIVNQRAQNPLIQKIDALLYDVDDNGNLVQKPNADKINIVFENKSRTNGLIIWDNNNMRPATEAFQISDDQIETLISKDGNDIGNVGVTARGSLGYITPGGQNRDNIYGISPDRSMHDGLVAISLKLPYLEDGAVKKHTPIIPFTPAPLTTNDVDFLVDLIVNYGKYQNRQFKINIDGKEYDSPLSAHNILYNILLRFHAGEETGNDFIIDFGKTKDNKTDFNTIVATQWGTHEWVEPFDLKKPEDIQRLKDYLNAGASVWYQNEALMMHGTSKKLDSTESNPFGGLEEFFRQNPNVDQIKYSDNLVFDRKDVDPDGDGSYKGIHGFTWMMRHGWMLSGYTGMQLPLMSTESVRLQQNVSSERSQQDEAPFIGSSRIEEQKVDKFISELGQVDLSQSAEISGADLDTLLSMSDDELNKIQSHATRRVLNREQAQKRLVRILGKNFPVRFIPQVVEMYRNGDISVGRLTKDGIILSDYAENGVEFHEAFHAVVEILLPKFARERLYEHYKKHYLNNKKVKNTVIAEGLADLYYDFKTNNPEVKFTWNILKLFKNILQYCRALASLDDIKIAMLFAATDAGVMRLFPASKEKFEFMQKRFKEGLNFTVTDDNFKTHTLRHYGNFKQIDDATDVIVYKLINGAGIDLLGANLYKLDTRLGAIQTMLLATPEEKDKMDAERQKLQGVYDDNEIWEHLPHSQQYKNMTMEGASEQKILKATKILKSDGTPLVSPLAARNALMFREMFDHWDLFRPIIENKIKSLGVDQKIVREQSAVEDMDGGEGHNQEEFGHYKQPFYEHSLREDVPSKIKYFLSTRPNRKFADADDVAQGRISSMYRVVDGKRERLYLDVKNNSMGYTTFMSYSSVYNQMLRMCHGARDISELDATLERLGKSDYLMYNIHKAFRRFRVLMYQRWNKNELDGDDKNNYSNKPKVIIRKETDLRTLTRNKTVMLHPSEYISDEFPTVVRYSHDIEDERGNIIHKKGDVIQNAVILTNPDYEQMVVQLFQAVHAQHLNFQHMYSVSELSNNGRPTGRFSYEVQSTSQDYDTQVYPKMWFNAIRSGFGGVFKVDENGNISVAVDDYGNKTDVFGKAAAVLRNIRTAVSSDRGKINVNAIPVNGQYKKLYDEDDFSEIEIAFVKALNSIGIQIDVQSLNYMLLLKYPGIELPDAFRQIFTSTSIDSIEPLIKKDTGVLDSLQSALNSGKVDLFFVDKASVTDPKKPENNVAASGFNMYGENGFLLDLAKWQGQFRLANRDAMQIGPNNTKLYTYAQHHSASEGVVELNHVFDDNGNQIEDGLVFDMKKSPYVISRDGSRGSVIAKTVSDNKFNPNHDRIKLATYEGIKLNTSHTGGTKYSEISAREDWLSKARLLQDGNIIFPTLSDKSTWFYLLGFVLPGINYNNINQLQLPKFSNTEQSRIFFNRDQFDSSSKQQYYSDQNSVIDQLIEYAYCELDLINQTINQLGIQKQNATTERYLEPNERIQNFHTKTMNGCRFAFLLGVYGKYTEKDEDFEFDENVDEFYAFNTYDPKNPEKSVLDSRERAMRVFFDKRVGETDEQLKARQRSMIANILQHRVKDQLDDLVRKGIIQKVDPNEAKKIKQNGKRVYSKKVSDFLGYRNLLLDHKAIDKLASVYRNMPIGNKTYGDLYSDEQIESAAVVAYVYDITAKSIMSKEETQRFFTGFPHFFKWKFDEKTGKLINIIEDESKRHGGQGSTGTSNITDLPNIDRTYRCAEIKDHEISSPLLKSLERAFRDNEYRDALVDLESQRAIDRQSNSTIGENISSEGSYFAKQLTNQKNEVGLIFQGKEFENAEHAYQTWKSGTFDEEAYIRPHSNPHGTLGVNTKINFSLMVKIITEKLHQHPELIGGINERGGIYYIANSVHRIKGSSDGYWQTSGKNRFIAALSIAYNNAINFESYNPEYHYTEEDADEELNYLSNIVSDATKHKLRSYDDILDSKYDEIYNLPLHEVINRLSSYDNGKIKQLVDNKIKAEVDSFVRNDDNDGVNVTDGTAYITDKMAEDLLRMRGAWNSDIQEAFEYLRGNSNKYLSSSKMYKKVVDALIGSQKYSAFGYRMQNGVPVHYYDKYALFPIFKGISYGFSSILYKKMNDPEYGIDMLMMESAVKVGRQAGQKFNPDMTEEELSNFSFKDHIYEQKYSMIRRQLNTDPHERDLMMFGTQAGKVALSTINDNQLYNLHDGSQIRGRDLLYRIMDSIKALSKIGAERVDDAFFDVRKNDNGVVINKKLNVQKFANFIQKELYNRNADRNILDAVRQLAVENTPILNSVSNMQWIESILISYINKNIIDVNLPGNAFYQRSVFGMEGIQSDDKFPVLANGNPLQMINEEGSMDAVVSIDFFYNIIPTNIRYNFKKAKQWLIDNNIISGIRSNSATLGGEDVWHNATANIMAYRIPTQAVSSIHALRIVDVLPVLRDTIVLPKEFTKITGSDFDIDKLYLSMIKYKTEKVKYRDTVTFDKTNIEYYATDHFDKTLEAESYHQNELLKTYIDLLKDAGKKVSQDEHDERMQLGKYIHMLHRPIDNDTYLIKRVLKKIESDKKITPVESFEPGSLYTQSNLKSNLATGKFGIGPFALNNNSHILTRLYNVSFKSSPTSILSLLNADSLHEVKDRDGESILSWMSALINAHVDVAKDPYILRLNVNKYTYNLISLLIRTGFGKDGFNFIAQPILKELAVEYQNSNGDIVDDPGLSPTERWKKKEQEFAKSFDYGAPNMEKKIGKICGSGTASYTNSDFAADSEVFKALFGMDNGQYEQGSVTLLEKLLTDKSFRIDESKEVSMGNLKKDKIIKIGNSTYSPIQLQGYVFLAKKLFDDYADALSTLVQCTKIDTKKHGISYLEQKSYMERYEKLKNYQNGLFDANLKFMLEDSFIDYKTNAAINILPQILGTQMIHFTPQFQDMVDKIQDVVSNKSMDTKRAIQNQLLTYVKQKCMNRVMVQQNIDFDSIIRGKNSLANRIEALKNKILSQDNPEYQFYASNGVITNAILANIHAVPYIPEYGQSSYSLLQLDNSTDDNSDIENDYLDSWDQMWQSQDQEIKMIARDLAIYAFMTSGDTRGLNKFFKYVPLNLRQDLGYVDLMNQMYRMFNSHQMELSLEGDSFSTINLNEFLKNSWRNNNITPVFNPSDRNVFTGHKMVYDDVNKQNGKIIKRSTYDIFAVTNMSRIKSVGTYPLYVKMHRPYASSKDVDPNLLYKLIYIGKFGNDEIPVYALTNSKGVSVRTGTDIYELYEFDRDDQNGHIQDGYRLDDVNWDAVTGRLVQLVSRWRQANPNYNESDLVKYVIENKASVDMKTGEPMVQQVISENEEGEQTIINTQPIEYRTILGYMYFGEKSLQREYALYDNNEEMRSQLRFDDKYKKFCKGD